MGSLSTLMFHQPVVSSSWSWWWCLASIYENTNNRQSWILRTLIFGRIAVSMVRSSLVRWSECRVDTGLARHLHNMGKMLDFHEKNCQIYNQTDCIGCDLKPYPMKELSDYHQTGVSDLSYHPVEYFLQIFSLEHYYLKSIHHFLSRAFLSQYLLFFSKIKFRHYYLEAICK